LYEYVPPVYEHAGPPVPDRSDLEQLGYVRIYPFENKTHRIRWCFACIDI